MWIAYLDESAEDEKKFMSVAALLCPVTQIQTVAVSLDKIIADSAELYGTSLDAEIHATDLLSRCNGWESLPDTDAAIGVIDRVVTDLCVIPGIHFVIRGVNIVGQQARNYPTVWNPRRVGIQHVLEKCNEYLKATASLMVIVDDMAKPEEHRELLKLYRTSGTPGFRNSKLKSIIDNIYFMPSHYTRGLQAADILAYVHRKHFTLKEQADERALAVSNRLWGKLMDSGKLRSYGIWPNLSQNQID